MCVIANKILKREARLKFSDRASRYLFELNGV